MTGLQLPSEDDIRKYMLENITEEQFKAMMEEDLKHEPFSRLMPSKMVQ